MPSKKELLASANLYLILDTEVKPYNELFDIAQQSLEAGIKILQLRDKKGKTEDILSFSKKLLTITKDRALYIMNDRIDMALLVGADGVHLGQEDASLKQARRLLSENFIIGVSCQNDEHALAAKEGGADYIGFGSIFKTKTKPERSPMETALLNKVVSSIDLPIFAIGGITLEQIHPLKKLNVKRFAVCRAICEASDVKKTVKQFIQQIEA